ncbi:helix-turn-helix transcriptional regulator [Janibacter cremeus]|uniref:DNA-binding CsgD family transcriptional regulator n=1 Tax=Janibacter cremeus TaxID=1285192 RepID=A0A852VZ77_9MICO|nr:helix-turn-helix transcriptional regulator [Janibacter cremeus]NYF98771.1 DNA-binding CsgD family transcriptional regulator [Janibacter cremeus]
MGVIEDLHRARDAYERREWLAAYRTLSELDDAVLAASDFLSLADAAELLGRPDDAVQALQRAHHAALGAADPLLAARAAARLGAMLALRGESAVAGGWLARGERVLEDVEDDVVERGYLLVGRMLEKVGVGDLEGARPLPEQITACGRRHADPNLVALGLNQEGRVLTVFGQVSEGLRLLDEAMVGVVAGEVDPLVAGEVYCSMIEACQWVGDLGRAAQWTRALSQWCDAQPALVAFTGQCAVHRAQLMRLHGALRDAVTELERSAARYELAGGHPAVALAHHERGDVLRLLGDLDGAERAYGMALQHGGDAQPGRALLAAAKGDLDQAVAAVRRTLAGTYGAIFRHRVIPGCVEVLLAGGLVEESAVLADELAGIAEDFGCTAVHAGSEAVAARVALAHEDPESALPAARSALGRWSSLDAGHEVARARVLVGRALRLLGDQDGAVLELVAAREAFVAQGAAPDARDAAAQLGHADGPGGLTAREVEVLCLVAAGRSNAQVAHDLHLSVKTVARHLSNIFTKLDVGSRTEAAAFAYRHGLC